MLALKQLQREILEECGTLANTETVGEGVSFLKLETMLAEYKELQIALVLNPGGASESYLRYCNQKMQKSIQERQQELQDQPKSEN
ncbi:MAG: hypothetical protein K2H29_02870 [Oscillospiraceae bacterium]|nr:hypothetical protein [Oscillospiraceae bacterium]